MWSLTSYPTDFVMTVTVSPLTLKRNLKMLLLVDPNVNNLASMEKLVFAALFTRNCYTQKHLIIRTLFNTLAYVGPEAQPTIKKGSNKPCAHVLES